MDVASLKDRIHRRSGHIAVGYKNCMLIWGGYMERMLDAEVEMGYSTYHYTDELWVYNSITEVWDRMLTKGDIPPKVSGCCALIHENNLYTFGGYQSVHEPETGTSNKLYRLDLITKTWKRIVPIGLQPVPCDKLAGWVYKNKLYFFGGFGPTPIGMQAYPFKHIVEVSTEQTIWPRGWNNQLVAYNIEEDCWEWPVTKGPIPSPRAAHAADITGSRVYLFGGRLKQIRNNELHCLNMETMMWSGNLTEMVDTNREIPEGRTWHTFTFVTPNQAVLYGGLSQHNVVLSDCWKLNMDSSKDGIRWERIKLKKNLPLLWHMAVYSSATNELLIEGGLKRSILASVTWRDHADELLILHFTPKSLFRLCLDTVYEYAHELESEFRLLPSTLQTIVRSRIDQNMGGPY